MYKCSICIEDASIRIEFGVIPGGRKRLTSGAQMAWVRLESGYYRYSHSQSHYQYMYCMVRRDPDIHLARVVLSRSWYLRSLSTSCWRYSQIIHKLFIMFVILLVFELLLFTIKYIKLPSASQWVWFLIQPYHKSIYISLQPIYCVMPHLVKISQQLTIIKPWILWEGSYTGDIGSEESSMEVNQ